ncbi:fumarylacetoacetase [Novosphingobium rosa]|uniref:fumarylacetoacetase n=1 Tax=Novosphingobium rosa TaxID=76978 RepID=UPI00082961AB|nr:fumarylacetoacetase [Novosphingobium rosa]
MTLPQIDHTHDAALKSWVPSADNHPEFPIQNLPFGVFSPQARAARIGVAIGDYVVDLAALRDILPEAASEALVQPNLNALFALPAQDRRALRLRLSELLSDDTLSGAVVPALYPQAEVTLHLPARIGDYTDFYVGIHHATNVGKLFRPDNPLLPNYKYVPIGYHGRASSVRPSGEPVVRPRGQRKAPDADAPVFEPSARLDYELELGIWVAQGNALGTTIPIGQASEHIAGISLLNDWSARDVQAWEYQPLGPFLAKNFHTTVSPWVVTTEALAPYRIAQPPRPEGDPAPLPYLLDVQDQAQGALSLTLSVWFSSAKMREEGRAPLRLSEGPASNMYWTLAQIVAHHASNGCNLNPGDLLGSGTISGPTPESYGSLLEITEGGKRPFTLPTGETRSFLQNGDEISITASAHAPGRASIGFGECRAVILATPA